jgi:hypothetical protein
MKRIILPLLSFFMAMAAAAQIVQPMGYSDYSFPHQVNVGNGTVRTTDPSATFQIDGTTKGFLGPRLTTTQRNAIASPALGLTIYNTSTKKWNTWNGTSWDVSQVIGTFVDSSFVRNDSLYNQKNGSNFFVTKIIPYRYIDSVTTSLHDSVHVYAAPPFFALNDSTIAGHEVGPIDSGYATPALYDSILSATRAHEVTNNGAGQDSIFAIDGYGNRNLVYVNRVAIENGWVVVTAVNYSGTPYTYDIGAGGVIRLNGVYYDLEPTTIIIDSSESQPRIDVLGADTSGHYFYKKGTPGSDPAKPTVDVGYQIELTHLNVPSGTGATPVLDTTFVYTDDLPAPANWVPLTNFGTTINEASTLSPHRGTTAVEITNVNAGDRWVFNYGSTYDLTGKVSFNGYIKLKQVVPSTATIRVQMMTAAGAAGNWVTLNLNKGNITNYQPFGALISAFGLTNTLVTGVQFQYANSSSTNHLGLHLDDIYFQQGIPGTQPANTIDTANHWVNNIYAAPTGDSIKFVIGNTVSIFKYKPTYNFTNSNIGSGYRLAVPNTNNIKTLFAGIDVLIDSTTNTNALTIHADTTTGANKLATQGDIDRAVLASTPTLQTVTNAGNTTDKTIRVLNPAGAFIVQTPIGQASVSINGFSLPNYAGEMLLSDTFATTTRYRINEIVHLRDTLTIPIKGINRRDTLATLVDIRSGISGITTPDLQAVTDVGAYTTTDFGMLKSALVGGEIVNANTTTSAVIGLNVGALNLADAGNPNTPYVRFVHSGGANVGYLWSDALSSGDRKWKLPDATGTIALTSDIAAIDAVLLTGNQSISGIKTFNNQSIFNSGISVSGAENDFVGGGDDGTTNVADFSNSDFLDLFRIKNDGGIIAPQLKHGTSTDSLVVWDPSSGEFKIVDASSLGGGGGSQDLQSVTDVGNTTSNSIVVGGLSSGGALFTGGYINFGSEVSSLSTPDGSIVKGSLYAKDDKHIWYINTDGTNYDLTVGSGGTVSTTTDNAIDISGSQINLKKIFQNLAFSSSASLDVSLGYNWYQTITGDEVVTPSNQQSGDVITFIVTQDPTGGHEFTFDTDIVPTKQDPDSITTIGCLYDGTVWHCTSDAVSGGTSTIAGATDANISSPADANILLYKTSNSKWNNVPVTGDVTISNTGATAIGASKVTNTMLAGSIAYNKLSLTGSVVNGDISGAIAETHGGTNQTSYTLGDVLYASASNTLSKLAGNTTTTKKFFTQTGNGTVSAAPGWNTIVAGDLPDLSGTYQPLDADITTIAGLTATTDNFLVSVSSAWASRTPAQVKTTLSLNNVDNTSDATKNSASVTLTNHAITPRVTSVASSGTPAPSASTDDIYKLTALAANATFGSPGAGVAGQVLKIRIKDAGTAKTLTWNAIYRASTDLPLPNTTIVSKTMYLTFQYNADDSTWDLLGEVNNFGFGTTTIVISIFFAGLLTYMEDKRKRRKAA